MNDKKDYYFEDIKELIHYLFRNYGKLSPLKLQKGLYFLFAYYGVQYGSNREELGNVEVAYNYPKFLFNANFEAWNYGPVIREVYFDNKNGNYDHFLATPINEEEVFDNDFEVKKFIKEIFDQVVTTSDFSLVDRSHEDIVWQNAHKDNQSEMCNEEIINEYAQEYIQ